MNNRYNDKKGRYEIKPVTIETVDQAVFDYFDKVLDLRVDVQRGREKVAIMYATGERWALIRKNKFRDKNGTLILPIVSIKRSDIDREPGFGGLAQEVPSIVVTKTIHPKTSNIQNMTNARRVKGFPSTKKEPVVEYLTIPYPDFATIYYEISIWAQYQTQMNEILEKIVYKYDHRDSFVMPVDYNGKLPKGDGYYFVGFRDGNITPQGNEEDITDQERILKYTYGIKSPVYLILDPKDEPLSYGKDRGEEGSTGKNIVLKSQNSIDVSLSENVVSLEDFTKIFG